MLDWKTEEQVLLHIKTMIAAVWRMNNEQLYRYQKKLQKHQQTVLPGRIGGTFLDILGQMSANTADAKAKAWPELMRDADRLLDLIHNQGNLQETAWLAALQKLEAQADRPFRTELGRSFILTLKEKLGIDIPETSQHPCSEAQPETDPYKPGNYTGMQVHVSGQTELEKIADWLMNDHQEEHLAPGKSIHFSAGMLQKAAITVCACFSICFMGIWLHGQVKRNQGRWNLQQMKISAAKEADVFMAQHPQTEADAVIQTEKQVKAGSNETSGTTTGSQTKEEASNSGSQTKEKAQIDGFETIPEILPQYQEIFAQYPELFGWLRIPGTQIDFPVMRTGGDDPEFYLHHDITGAESAEGSLFVDTLSSLYPQDDNTVVYGHNMKNGHIFGTLKQYGTVTFFQEHQKIYFDTIYEIGVYEAVAVLKTRIRNENEQGFRYYQFFQYENEKEFQECRDFVEENRLFETGSTLQYGDRILMLSTCEYSQENGRLVVVARETESME